MYKSHLSCCTSNVCNCRASRHGRGMSPGSTDKWPSYSDRPPSTCVGLIFQRELNTDVSWPFTVVLFFSLSKQKHSVYFHVCNIQFWSRQRRFIVIYRFVYRCFITIHHIIFHRDAHLRFRAVLNEMTGKKKDVPRKKMLNYSCPSRLLSLPFRNTDEILKLV